MDRDTLGSSLRRGARSGFLWFGACLVSDAAHGMLTSRRTWLDGEALDQAVVAAATIGVGVPGVLLFALLGAVSSVGGSLAGRAMPALARECGRILNAATHPTSWSRDTLAAVLASSVAALLALGATVAIGSRIVARIHTPFFATVAVLLVLGVSGLATAALSGYLLWAFRRIVERIPEVSERTRRRLWISSAVATSAGGVLALVLLHVAWPSIAWGFLIGPLAGTLLLGLAARSQRRRPRATLAVACAFAVAGVATLVAPSPLRPALTAAKLQPSVGAVVLQYVTAALDVDRDGGISLYGGSDCAPFDPKVGPTGIDEPGNGLDEDCTGFDADPILSTTQLGPSTVAHGGAWRPRPHVLLVTTDSLTYSTTGMGGGRPGVTPHLDAWASRSTIFERTFAVAPVTRQALLGLMSGTYPSRIPEHYPEPHSTAPEAQIRSLAQVFGAAGYRTVAILGSWKGLHDIPFVKGGFATWEMNAEHEYRKAGGTGFPHTAPRITRRAIDEISKPDDAPLFLWVHYYDHHAPFEPDPSWPNPRNDDSPRGRHERELTFADAHWGQLFAAIESKWAAEDYLLVFTADHGEAFDAHHLEKHHGMSLRTAELHVPLVIQGPRGRRRRVRSLVSHLDLTPTIVNVAGLSLAQEVDGATLVPLLLGDAAPPRSHVFSVMSYPELRSRFDSVSQVSVRTADWYLWRHRAYDASVLSRWETSPLDDDVMPEHPEVADGLGAALNRELRRLEGYATQANLGVVADD